MQVDSRSVFLLCDEMALDQEIESDADNQDDRTCGQEFGWDEDAAHEGKQVISGQASEKDGTHVAAKWIAAGGAEDPEDVEGNERGEGCHEDAQERQFEEMVHGAPVDFTVAYFL